MSAPFMVYCGLKDCKVVDIKLDAKIHTYPGDRDLIYLELPAEHKNKKRCGDCNSPALWAVIGIPNKDKGLERELDMSLQNNNHVGFWCGICDIGG